MTPLNLIREFAMRMSVATDGGMLVAVRLEPTAYAAAYEELIRTGLKRDDQHTIPTSFAVLGVTVECAPVRGAVPPPSA